MESFYAKLKFRKKKWLFNCSYNPKHNSIESHLDSLSKSTDSLSSKYDNLILLGDFNSCMEDSPMKTFGEIYSDLFSSAKSFADVKVVITKLRLHLVKQNDRLLMMETWYLSSSTTFYLRDCFYHFNINVTDILKENRSR